MVNHWWQVTLYVTARGLTTSAMPYQGRTLQIDFDFSITGCVLRTSDGRSRAVRARAALGGRLLCRGHGALRALGVDVHIWTMPSEIEGAIPFEQDRAHAAYDRDAAQRFWRQLVQADRVLDRRSARRFLGKCSPVHFFWGSFDLAVTRFSGRTAPPLPSGAPERRPTG